MSEANDELYSKKVEELEQFGRRHSVNTINLAIAEHGKALKGWNLAKQADLTVILYKNYIVQANHALRTGELNDKQLDQIATHLVKMVEN